MAAVKESTPLLSSSKLNHVEFEGLGLFASVAYLISVFGIPPIVALPGAVEYCGYLGFFIVPCIIIIGTYTAVILSKSFLLLEEYWPKEALANSKYPYSALGQKVGGPFLRRIVKIIQNLAIFGECVPFLLLASENIHNVMDGIASEKVGFSFCYILVLTALILIPISWLGTPKDLRYVTWVGAGSVVVMCVLVMGLLFLYPATSYTPVRSLPSSWRPVAYSFGAVAFQFGIHCLLLALQMDMKNKQQIPSAIIIAFTVSFFMYGFIAASAFFFYGDSVRANIMNNFEDGVLLYIAQGILSIQALICLTQGINALFQDLEETIGIPDFFGWRRIVLRTTVMVLVLFVAESIPHFALALELVGGLLMTPIVFIFPPWFYGVIKYKATGEIQIFEILVGIIIVTIGVIGCIASTIESGIQITYLKEIAPPCYIDIERASDASLNNNEPIF